MEFKSIYNAVALTNFPHFVINREVKNGSGEYFRELTNILQFYYDYKKGVDFYPEGSKGDYVPSNVKYKNIKSLVDKESRFMFSQMPDVNLVTGNVEDGEKTGTYKKIIEEVIERSGFSGKLLQASKDCFIGKRVAWVVDYSDRVGVGIHFYDSLNFYYETEYGSEELTKLITFENVSSAKNTKENIFLVNRYERTGIKVNFSSIIYDIGGKEIEVLVSERRLGLNDIPGGVIINTGVLSDTKGVSDVEDLILYEEKYNLLGNADIDSERKGMNPIVVLIDMNHETTKDLSSSAGSVWDLEHSQEINEAKPQATILAPSMNHVEAVKTTLDRLRSTMYSELDIPDISVEGTLSGITSYKAIKALYFPLTVRCDEKLKVWKPQLKKLFETVLRFCVLNSKRTKEIYEVEELPDIKYKVMVVENYALLADENEEKAIDLDEVNVMARSRFSYIKKWRSDEFRTDKAIEEEIKRIAVEQNMMDTLSMNTSVQRELEKEEEERELEDVGGVLKAEETYSEN